MALSMDAGAGAGGSGALEVEPFSLSGLPPDAFVPLPIPDLPGAPPPGAAGAAAGAPAGLAAAAAGPAAAEAAAPAAAEAALAPAPKASKKRLKSLRSGGVPGSREGEHQRKRVRDVAGAALDFRKSLGDGPGNRCHALHAVRAPPCATRWPWALR